MKSFNLKLSHFNPFINWQYLFKRTPTLHFSTVDGLRALAVLWVMSGHFFHYFGDIAGKEQFQLWLKSAPWKSLAQGHFGIDAFFIVSGFVIGFLLMHEWKKNQSINIKRFYVRRVIRVIPPYFVALMLYPLCSTNNLEYIWTNILFINNFISIKHQVMTWSWTLAVEVQFYIMIPFVLLYLFRNKKQAPLILLTILFASIAIRWVVIENFNIQTPLAFHAFQAPREFINFFDAIYCNFYTRFGALFFGVGAAYLFVFTNVIEWLEKRRALSIVLLWLSLGLLCFSFLHSTFATEGWIIKWSTPYIAMMRHVFSMAISYMLIFSLTPTGKNSVFGKFLSANGWYPIAQMSYSAYLIHPILMIYFLKNILVSAPTSMGLVLVYGFAVMVTVFLASILMYLFVERPFLNARAR